ncbi:MAG: hypothetical protein HC819_08080 [Cyclobacteriaceae bacterium]|nr:hypothetical protein [Cyclobacteriaceae bacterium]
MTITDSRTNYFGGLVMLYHLLINADGHIDEKELSMGRLMKQHENIDDWEFEYHLKRISDLSKQQIINDCIASLKKCDEKLKLKCIAWMSLIANSDGFMAPEEWKLIYYIYNTELKLNLKDILETQKMLPRPR